MKAKVIETGEIVNVTPYPTWYKENGQGPDRREWDEDELEFIYSDKKEENFDLDKDIKEFVTTDEFEKDSAIAGHYWAIAKHAFLLGLKVKKVDLTDRKTEWSPSKKQMDSLKDMLKYNIGVFDYQKFMEVNSLYDDLTKI